MINRAFAANGGGEAVDLERLKAQACEDRCAFEAAAAVLRKAVLVGGRLGEVVRAWA